MTSPISLSGNIETVETHTRSALREAEFTLFQFAGTRRINTAFVLVSYSDESSVYPPCSCKLKQCKFGLTWNVSISSIPRQIYTLKWILTDSVGIHTSRRIFWPFSLHFIFIPIIKVICPRYIRLSERLLSFHNIFCFMLFYWITFDTFYSIATKWTIHKSIK